MGPKVPPTWLLQSLLEVKLLHRFALPVERGSLILTSLVFATLGTGWALQNSPSPQLHLIPFITRSILFEAFRRRKLLSHFLGSWGWLMNCNLAVVCVYGHSFDGTIYIWHRRSFAVNSQTSDVRALI